MRILLMILVLWVSNGAMAGGSTEVTVGSDGACDYSSLTAASLNAPGSGLLDIKLAKNHTMNSIQILGDRETTINGGYDTCADSSVSGRTVIDGSSFSGAIFVVTEATSTTLSTVLSLVDMEISGGNSNTSGGAISLTGSWTLLLDNTIMKNNISNSDGGAIYLEQSSDSGVRIPQLSIINNSILSNNSADNGGAIACEGLGNIYAFNMQLAFNSANQNGGAVYVNNRCAFEQFGGGLFQGVIFNEAVSFGGGIHASNNSIIRLRGEHPEYGVVTVNSNTAANGGGISVSSGSTLTAKDALINHNTASSTGGGIRSNSGHVIVERVKTAAQCHSEIRCSTISNNVATGTEPTFAGGGAIATFGGTLEVRGTYIEDNTASFGSAIRARFMGLDGLTPEMKIVGNVVAGNQNAPQVVYLDDSSADIAFSTFVDNEDMDRVIEVAYPLTAGDANLVRVSGSIFAHPGSSLPSAELTTSGQFPVGDCNRNEPISTGDLIGEPRSTTTAVQFENQSSGDYRLIESSVLVDFCDWSILGSDSDHSANGLPRPIDNSIGDLHGTYDLGGLERYDLDLIFADDFD